MSEHDDPAAMTAAFRWDFVTDPPTQFLTDLATAQARLHWGHYAEARFAAKRLLRRLDAKAPRCTPATCHSGKLQEIRADALAVRAIASRHLGRPGGPAALDECLSAYDELRAQGDDLRPPSLAVYGMALALSGRHAAAVEPVVRAVEAGEHVSVDVVRDMGRRLLVDEDPPAAVRLLRAVHERYPGDADVAADLAGAAERAGDQDEAAGAYVAAGAMSAQGNRYDEALQYFARSLRLSPEHPLAALGQCQALLAVGRVDDALSAAAEVRRTQPDLAGSHAVHALGLALVGRRTQALADLDEVLQTFPDDPWLLDTRIRLLMNSGAEQAALAAVEHALQVDPTDREWLSLRAEILLAGGEEVETALQILRDLASSFETIQPTVRLVRALTSTDHPDEALRVLERSLLDRPSDATLLTLRVEVLVASGRHAEAAASAGAAVDQGVLRTAVAVPWAEALLRLGEGATAAAMAGEALTADSASVPARRIHGLAMHRTRRYSEAVTDLETVWSAQEDEEVRRALSDSLSQLGASNVLVGDAASGRPLLERAVELDGDNLVARRWLAELLRRVGDFVQALEHADAGLTTAPDDAWLIGTRGQILRGLRHSRDAEQELRRAVDLDPGLAWARTELAELLRGQRRYAEALGHLDEAVRTAPEDPWPWVVRGATEYALDRYDRALQSVDRALALEPDYGWAHALRATVLLDVDELQAAERHVDRSLELDASVGWASLVRGRLLLLESVERGVVVSSKAGQALEAYRQARQQEPGSVEASVGMAEAHHLLGDREQSVQAFEDLVAGLQPASTADAVALVNLGWSLLRLGRHDEAVEAFVRAVAADPAHVTAVFDLALTLLCAGRVDVALEECAQAIARVRAVRHAGRRRALLRAARHSLDVLSLDQLVDRGGDVLEVRTLLDGGAASDVRSGSRGVPV